MRFYARSDVDAFKKVSMDEVALTCRIANLSWCSEMLRDPLLIKQLPV